MAVLTFLYKNGLWLSWPLFGLGVFLLWFCIVTVVRLGDKNLICSLPLEAEQSVDFAEAGQVILWLKGPQLTTRFAGISYELTGMDGSSNRGRMCLFRLRSSGWSKMRFTDRVFTLSYPGRYVLHIRGLGDPRPNDDKHRILFMRPYLPQSIGCVLGILLGSFLVIGSTVNFILRLTQGGPA
jgi:hypothetical protein